MLSSNCWLWVLKATHHCWITDHVGSWYNVSGNLNWVASDSKCSNQMFHVVAVPHAWSELICGKLVKPCACRNQECGMSISLVNLCKSMHWGKHILSAAQAVPHYSSICIHEILLTRADIIICSNGHHFSVLRYSQPVQPVCCTIMKLRPWNNMALAQFWQGSIQTVAWHCIDGWGWSIGRVESDHWNVVERNG